MTLQYVPLPLFEDEDYEYQISLESNSYLMRIYYNSRSKLWDWELKTEAGILVVAGETLVPNYPIGIDYSFENLTGYLWLEPTSNISSEKYKEFPFNLSNYYRLFYIYNDGE